jgi:hypothetical protein
LKNLIGLVCRIEPDTVTASSGDSLPVIAAKDSNFIRAPFNRANALRTSICGEAFRSSLLARQRQQRQLDPNDKSHKTNNPETIISSSSAPPPRPPSIKKLFHKNVSPFCYKIFSFTDGTLKRKEKNVVPFSYFPLSQ